MTPVPKLQQGPGCTSVARSNVSNQRPRVFSCEELERSAGPEDQADGRTDAQPSVLEGLRLLKMKEAHSPAQNTDRNEIVPSVEHGTDIVIAPCSMGLSKDVASNETQDFKLPPKIKNVAVASVVSNFRA